MALIKRVFLFLAVNLLVMFTLSLLITVLGVGPRLTAHGYNYQSLMIFCLIWGMGGSFISLLLSRFMAKQMMGVQVIDPQTRDPELQHLLQMVHRLSRAAYLPVMPEVGIYDSPEMNAFATGPTKSRALVAVSTGLLNRMRVEEVEGVVGHEVSHIANGDMVTMTLLQGIVNAFAMFLSYIVALVITQMIQGNQADEGGARLAGRHHMIQALEALRRNFEAVQPQENQTIQALQISSKPTGLMALFSSHPPLEERIARLQRM
ncbi:protease HtpX [bacterium]|nr:protease HtpX [bacterium]